MTLFPYTTLFRSTNFLVQMHRKIRLDDLIRDLNQIEGVYTVEEF